LQTEIEYFECEKEDEIEENKNEEDKNN